MTSARTRPALYDIIQCNPYESRGFCSSANNIAEGPMMGRASVDPVEGGLLSGYLNKGEADHNSRVETGLLSV